MPNTPDAKIRPRLRVWQELRLTTDTVTNVALAGRLDTTARTIERVMGGEVSPSSDFIARALVAFPFASFDRLFTIIVEPAR